MRKTLTTLAITVGMVGAFTPPTNAGVTSCVVAAYAPKAPIGLSIAVGSGRAQCFSMHKQGQVHPPSREPVSVSDRHKIEVRVQQYRDLPWPLGGWWDTIAYARTAPTGGKPGTERGSLYESAVGDCEGDRVRLRTVVRHEIWGVGGFEPKQKTAEASLISC